MMKKRVILWWMLFVGIIIHMFQKTNINIAIISMIKHEQKLLDNDLATSSDAICIREPNNSFIFESQENYYEINENSSLQNNNNKLPWDEHAQNVILGGFFWFAWLAQFFGGILAHKFGSKLTFGLSNFIACVLSAAIPKLAFLDYRFVVAVRVLQGFIASLGVPAGLIQIVGQWSPPHERGKFMSVFLGVAFGVAVGYPIFGTIGEYFGWPCIFYSCSIVGALWYVAWVFLVYDSPDQHPTITPEEKKYIMDHIGGNISKERLPIPWKDILTSVPFLINVCCQFGTQWCVHTLNIYIPSFFRFVHGLDMKTGGYIAGVAFALKSGMSLFAASITDFIIRKKILNTQYVRKLSVFVSSVVAGFILIGIPYAECDLSVAAICLIIAIMLHAFFLTGATVAILDMSPNFSSVLQGICGTIAVSAGFMSPFVIDQLPYTNSMMEKWKWLFGIAGGMSIGTGAMFILFSNSYLQPWNSGRTARNDNNSVEMRNGKNKE